MNVLLLICVFLPMLCAPFCLPLAKRSAALRDAFTVTVTVLASIAALLSVLCNAVASIPAFCGVGIALSTGGFRSVLLLLCALVFPLSALSSHAYFGTEPRTGRYQAFFLVTYGALLGVFASSDLFTTYVFFEMMSLSSWVWVAQNETQESGKAADTYLAIAIIGGLTMLYGVLYLQYALGTLSFAALSDMRGVSIARTDILVAAFCLLVGFGAKAGMYPLHIWLPKAHPVAPAPASALLSGILTKAGIFGILLLASGVCSGDLRFAITVLVLGVITMLLGAVLAICSNDLKRTLACSSLSQIGFILVGCAILAMAKDTAFAAGGAVLHAVNHALIKLVLFICAGAIYKRNHTLDLNLLRGAGRGNLSLMLCFSIGALSIAGVPGFGGYISKTLLHEAIAENAALFGGATGTLLTVTEWLFLLAGGLTLAYMGKLFYRLFIEKGDCVPVRLDAGTAVAITVPSVLLLLCGLFPGRTYLLIAKYAAGSLGAAPFSVQFFSPANLKGAAISLCIGAVTYALVVRKLLTDNRTGRYLTIRMPFTLEDSVYKPLLAAASWVCAFFARLAYSITDWVVAAAERILHYGAPDRVKPGRDDHFAHYSRKYVRFGRIEQTLAFELLLFGAGVVITLLYLLLR